MTLTQSKSLTMMKILVAGWFSFDDMGATAGDLIAKNLVCTWIQEANIDFDVAVAETYRNYGNVNWRLVDPAIYPFVVFVCGPFGNGWPLTDFLENFSTAKLIGVNLSMLDSLDSWNPFHLLFERDSSRCANPDITFHGDLCLVPVVGLILAHKQKEYGKRALHEQAEEEITTFLGSLAAAVVPIDTAIPNNKTGLKTAAEVESLIQRMDLVITTRLHGMVLSIKNNVPAIAIDPIAGGEKIARQVKTIGWPVLLYAEFLNQDDLRSAFGYCLTAAAKVKARDCATRAFLDIEVIHQDFVSELRLLQNT